MATKTNAARLLDTLKLPYELISYEVDEEAKTIKLMYETALEDTVFYFERTENGLAIEYPWLMRKR